MHFREIEIPGCYEVHFLEHRDTRGLFVKTIHGSSFEAQGLRFDFRETFFSESGENVVRGMHFQLPPADYTKLVYCVAGSVLDVCLDLRSGSPTFGRFTSVRLSAKERNGMYLPSGVAHGFQVLQAPAVVMYHVTAEHTPALDAGIRWDSFGAPWQTQSPLVSPRDSAFPTLAQFRTPFEFHSVAPGEVS